MAKSRLDAVTHSHSLNKHSSSACHKVTHDCRRSNRPPLGPAFKSNRFEVFLDRSGPKSGAAIASLRDQNPLQTPTNTAKYLVTHHWASNQHLICYGMPLNTSHRSLTDHSIRPPSGTAACSAARAPPRRHRPRRSRPGPGQRTRPRTETGRKPAGRSSLFVAMEERRRKAKMAKTPWSNVRFQSNITVMSHE